MILFVFTLNHFAMDFLQGYFYMVLETEFLFLRLRQASEQYFTSSQTAFHFLRHAKGRWQHKQTLVGKSAFLSI